jgi:hypothetical protein
MLSKHPLPKPRVRCLSRSHFTKVFAYKVVPSDFTARTDALLTFICLVYVTSVSM